MAEPFRRTPDGDGPPEAPRTALIRVPSAVRALLSDSELAALDELARMLRPGAFGQVIFEFRDGVCEEVRAQETRKHLRRRRREITD